MNAWLATFPSLNGRIVVTLVGIEGERATMYRDQVGLPTIGVGHRLTVSELASGKLHVGPAALRWAAGLSPTAIDTLLAQDTSRVAAALSALVTVVLSQPQFDALLSWAFNVGVEAVAQSTLLRLLNQGRYDAVPAQLRRWVHDHQGHVLPVLERRRETEITRWEGADT